VAFDGIKLNVPRTSATLKQFDRPRNSWLRSHFPQALVVVAVDLYRRVPIDWCLLPKKTGERDAVLPLANSLREGDIAVFDRGFPARWLVGGLMDRRIDVVVRMTVSEANAWPEVKQFLRTGKKEAVVEIKVGPKGEQRIERARLIFRKFKGKSKNGKKSQPLVIMTTLMDEKQFDREEILKLYTARWGIETCFREVKCAFSIEQFHARSILGIEQEIAAVLVWIALGSSLQHLAEVGLPEGRRVYRNLCFAKATRIMEAYLRGDDLDVLIQKAIEAISRYHYLPQKDRHFPRVRKSPYRRWNQSAK
jgi:hypothetical protein